MGSSAVWSGERPVHPPLLFEKVSGTHSCDETGPPQRAKVIPHSAVPAWLARQEATSGFPVRGGSMGGR